MFKEGELPDPRDLLDKDFDPLEEMSRDLADKIYNDYVNRSNPGLFTQRIVTPISADRLSGKWEPRRKA